MDEPLVPSPSISDVFSDLPAIATPRLLLRKMRLEDAADMFAYAHDSDVARYLVWTPHRDIAETTGYLAYVTSQYARGHIEDWGIVDAASGTFIGTAGYFFWDVSHRRAEIHYCLSKAWWGRGIMKEAVTAIIDFGFSRMGLHRIEAKCFPENAPSEALLRSVGMRFEGTMREGLFAKGSFHDLRMYAVLSTDRGRSS